jgi:hypothetical protein
MINAVRAIPVRNTSELFSGRPDWEETIETELRRDGEQTGRRVARKPKSHSDDCHRDDQSGNPRRGGQVRGSAIDTGMSMNQRPSDYIVGEFAAVKFGDVFCPA